MKRQWIEAQFVSCDRRIWPVALQLNDFGAASCSASRDVVNARLPISNESLGCCVTPHGITTDISQTVCAYPPAVKVT
jgi:hypothetical protein